MVKAPHGCVVHSDRGSQFRSRKFLRALEYHGLVGSMGRVGAAGDNAAMESFFCPVAKQRPKQEAVGHSETTQISNRGLE